MRNGAHSWKFRSLNFKNFTRDCMTRGLRLVARQKFSTERGLRFNLVF